MQLTKFSDYSLRVLMYAHAARGRRVTIGEVAAAHRISRAHLMKVVNSLARAGYLTAVRGRSGGFILARPAEDIGLGEVVRATEPSFALVECFSTNNQCVLAGRCWLGRVFDQALRAFLAVLDQHTLASRSAKAQRLPPIAYRGGLPGYRLRRVLEYIGDNLAKDLSVPKLAAVAGMSPNHFAEMFKSSTGCAPRRYVLLQRIEFAKRELSDTKCSILEVRLNAGFQNSSHFACIFRKFVGTSPSRFRNQRGT
jgi:Rrf2 family nitric oxide-sensitive transcriptional repressor